MRMDVEKPIIRLLDNFSDIVLISNMLFRQRKKTGAGRSKKNCKA